jgi:hypothetical protein
MDSDAQLDELCTELDLSPEERLAVTRCVGDLRRLPLLKSGASRSLELLRLQRQVQALRSTLRELDGYTQQALHSKLGDLGFPGPLLDRDPLTAWSRDLSLRGTYELLGLIDQAAVQVESEILPWQKRRGRTATLHLHAIVVGNLQHAICRPGAIEFARSGDFQRLCDAVFAAAGVPSKSAGAIDYLQQWRKDSDGVLPLAQSPYDRRKKMRL